MAKISVISDIRPFVLGAMLFAAMLVLSVPAWADTGPQCNDGAKPSLSVKTATTRTKYIRTKSSKDLTDMHGGGGGGSSVGGLGGGEIGFKAETRYKVIEADGAACVTLDRLDVTFYAKPEIHIASNFARSTCEYNAVMAHEKKHIAILRKFVREYSPKVKKSLVRFVSKLDTSAGPVGVSQVNLAQKEIETRILAEVKRLNDKMMPILAKRQQRLDNPQEYARVAAQCNKWDQKLDRR